MINHPFEDSGAPSCNATVGGHYRCNGLRSDHLPPSDDDGEDCGGPREACAEPGCKECGAPAPGTLATLRARVARLELGLREVENEILAYNGGEEHEPGPVKDLIDAIRAALAGEPSTFRPTVVCRPCSIASGSDRNIEHQGPACKERKS